VYGNTYVCSYAIGGRAGRTEAVRRLLLVGWCAVILLGGVAATAPPAGSRTGRAAGIEGGYDPVWSPDGTKLAYIGPLSTATSTDAFVLPRHVEVVPIDGSALPRAVVDAPRDQALEAVRWASGGRFVYQDSNYTLWSDVPGTPARRLAIAGTLDEAFALSRNGRRVAYTAPCACSIAQGNAVGIVAAAGGQPLHLRRAPNELDYEPSFSPDGRQLVFSRLLEGPSEPTYPHNESLVVEPVRGGRERSLHVIGDRAAFSPDGRWLAFFGPAGLEAMPVSGRTPRLLRAVLHVGDELAFSWSHDSTRLVYAMRSTLGTVDLSGKGTAFSIPGLRPTANTPQWSPDDASIAFTAAAPAPDIRVYVIAADGSGLRRIA
jgi:Tol biopolymer transport system component